ncbi:MAG: hypothetical protein KC731_13620 [Myxococcales bacterium]|nr:hypothetical protein [Myxococcales bacterium]
MLSISATSFAQDADGDDGKAACLAAFQATQAARDAGQLLRAREQALACSQEQCPEVVTSKCKTWLREISTQIPSLVVRAVDEAGHDLSEATLIVDGTEVKSRLDGLPVELDPGEHRVVVQRADGPALEERVVVTLGEQARPIVLRAPRAAGSLAPQPAPPPTPAEMSIHPLTWVGVALAGAGLVAGAITGGLSLAKTAELEEACGGDKHCPPSAEPLHDRATLLSHVSTASFAAAGVGAALGAIGIFVLSDGLFDGPSDGPSVAIGPGSVVLRGRF